jgi:hypothetical protein
VVGKSPALHSQPHATELTLERIGNSRIRETIPHVELLPVERSTALPDHDPMLGMKRHDGVVALMPLAGTTSSTACGRSRSLIFEVISPLRYDIWEGQEEPVRSGGFQHRLDNSSPLAKLDSLRRP